MAFNISDFSSNINRYGTLRNNKYKIQIAPPPFLGSVSSSANEFDIFRQMTFRADQVTMPGVSFENQVVNRYGIGPKQRFPTNAIFPETVSISFIESNENDIHKFISLWMNNIFYFHGENAVSKPYYLTRYKSDYSSIIEITIYSNEHENSENQIANIIYLKDAFPSSISENQLAWGDNNTLFRVNVEFSFTEWSSAFISIATSSPETNPPG
jgi:hypothetical protein